jgi:hypothetical protein
MVDDASRAFNRVLRTRTNAKREMSDATLQLNDADYRDRSRLVSLTAVRAEAIK